MEHTEFLHVLDQWLADHGLAPALLEPSGLAIFHSATGACLGAELLPGRRMELFAGIGYVSADAVRALGDDMDDGAKPHEGPLAPVLSWRNRVGEWLLEVGVEDGLLSLVCTTAAPASGRGWADVVVAFDRSVAQWAASLSPVRLAFDARPMQRSGMLDSAVALLRA